MEAMPPMRGFGIRDIAWLRQTTISMASTMAFLVGQPPLIQMRGITSQSGTTIFMISPRLQRMVTSTAIKGASNGVIRHNVFYISQGQNAAVAIWNSLRSSDNILVDNNLAAGSGFSDVRRRLSSFGAESRGWFF